MAQETLGMTKRQDLFPDERAKTQRKIEKSRAKSLPSWFEAMNVAEPERES